jgi:hypothetical protein
MLTSLLPGLRDLRTPLATGYLWLTALWLCLGSSIPDTSEFSGFAEKTLNLASSFPDSALLAALTFVAYLLGTTLTVNVRPFSSLANRLARPVDPDVVSVLRDRVATTIGDLKSRQQLDLPDIAVMLGDRNSRDDINGAPEHNEYFDELMARCIEQQDITILTMQGSNSSYFDNWDRLNAESDFRLSIASPLIVLAIAGAMRTFLSVDVNFLSGCVTVLIASIVVLFAVILYIKGLSLRRDARTVLIQTLGLEDVRIPLLTRISNLENT